MKSKQQIIEETKWSSVISGDRPGAKEKSFATS
jgi:hypothetical protein